MTTTSTEAFDALTAANDTAARLHQQQAAIAPNDATQSDVLTALTAIAQELRTANLLAYATLLDRNEQMDTRTEVGVRLGLIKPDASPFGPFGHSG